MIAGLELTPDQFVDLCILCGCDYCGTIKGTAYAMSFITNVLGAREDISQ